ncbi:hypothetical protein G5714_020478 [Onychostoma macrolepis]|uniref:Uncharacterized protein n=1 Tax=Onychostoma macrolepis TaxID=369639 RepID=A0A7J6BTZ9_9TELE|nr:hypothetical protein G5714_020478 [Onychostoma macrolepis]
MSARLRSGRREMKENLCRPGGVISTHFGWPPASRQDIQKKRSGPRETRSRKTTADPCLPKQTTLYSRRGGIARIERLVSPHAQLPRKLGEGALGQWKPSPLLGSALFTGCRRKDVDEG